MHEPTSCKLKKKKNIKNRYICVHKQAKEKQNENETKGKKKCINRSEKKKKSETTANQRFCHKSTPHTTNKMKEQKKKDQTRKTIHPKASKPKN